MATHTPELWAKTTELWAGAYTSNLAFYPISKFVPIVSKRILLYVRADKINLKLDSGSYVLMAPASPSSVFPLAGDMQINCGIVVKAIIEAGSKALGKVVVLVTDYVPFKEIASEFENVTGKSAIHLDVSDEDFSRVWGPFGTELACHLRWGEHYSDWNAFPLSVYSVLRSLALLRRSSLSKKLWRV